MGILEEAKKTCPACSSPNMKRATINKEGIDIPANICTACGWNGVELK